MTLAFNLKGNSGHRLMVPAGNEFEFLDSSWAQSMKQNGSNGWMLCVQSSSLAAAAAATGWPESQVSVCGR